MIRVQGLTKEFGNGRGIFGVSFEVHQGEVFGYLGPNGAGKSTTIRHLMGFMKPDRGRSTIDGLDCWAETPEVQRRVGYLPGEIAFVDGMTGLEFLNLVGGMRSLRNLTRRNDLIDRFQFDVKTPIRKMSKGMKQKVGIVAAFMHDPAVYILDEPTSGLDPLMQKRFMELILEEKARGKTILISCHIFQEIERTADRVAILKDGRVIAEENIHQLQSTQRRLFEVTVSSAKDVETLQQFGLRIVDIGGNRMQIEVQGNYDDFIRALSQVHVTAIDVHSLDLEEIFMHFYDRKEATIS